MPTWKLGGGFVIGSALAVTARFELAVAVEDGLPYLQSPYWCYPVRQSLGAVLRRQAGGGRAGLPAGPGPANKMIWI